MYRLLTNSRCHGVRTKDVRIKASPPDIVSVARRAAYYIIDQNVDERHDQLLTRSNRSLNYPSPAKPLEVGHVNRISVHLSTHRVKRTKDANVKYPGHYRRVLRMGLRALYGLCY